MAFSFVFIFNLVAGAAETVLSQTVGAVGDEIVSSRDVQIQSVLEKNLFPAKQTKTNSALGVEKSDKKNQKPKKSSTSLNTDEAHLKEPQFQAELSSSLLELVIQKEAESFRVAQPSEEELKESLQKAEKALVGSSLWTQLDVSEKELSAVLKRKLTAKKFIKIKTDLMSALVTDQDALNYYEKNRFKFGQLPFSNFKENIKTYLAQQQMEERLKTLFEVIKRKYKVRNYIVEGRSAL